MNEETKEKIEALLAHALETSAASYAACCEIRALARADDDDLGRAADSMCETSGKSSSELPGLVTWFQATLEEYLRPKGPVVAMEFVDAPKEHHYEFVRATKTRIVLRYGRSGEIPFSRKTGKEIRATKQPACIGYWRIPPADIERIAALGDKVKK